jgi:hypothetical protein
VFCVTVLDKVSELVSVRCMLYAWLSVYLFLLYVCMSFSEMT